MREDVMLVDFWASPFGMRVRIALAEKKVTYEYREEDLPHKSQLLLRMNPVHKKIPVLIHNGKPVCESLLAVQYIDETWPDISPLLPRDPYERSQARFWADFVDKKIHDSGRKLWGTLGEDRVAGRNEFVGYLKCLEDALGEMSFFGGDTLGLVDVTFIPFYCWFYTYEVYGEFNVQAECPKIAAWAKRCMEFESVYNSLPDPLSIYDYVRVLRKRFLGVMF